MNGDELNNIHVALSAEDDNYDKFLNKTIEKHNKLNETLSSTKGMLEDLNSVYENSAHGISLYSEQIKVLEKVSKKIIKTTNSTSSGSNTSSTGGNANSDASFEQFNKTKASVFKQQEEVLQKHKVNLDKLADDKTFKNLGVLFGSLQSLSGALSSGTSLSSVLRTSLKTALKGIEMINSGMSKAIQNNALNVDTNRTVSSTEGSTEGRVKNKSNSTVEALKDLGVDAVKSKVGNFNNVEKLDIKRYSGVAPKAGSRSGDFSAAFEKLASTSKVTAKGASTAGGSSALAGALAIGGVALGVTLAVVALTAAVAKLVSEMVKLGEEGYKAQIKIANSQNVLGSSFKGVIGYARDLNAQLGIAEDRTASMVANTAQIAKASGFSTQSSAIMGVGANKMATNIALSTGGKVEDVQAAINEAIANGSNSTSQYGINMSDNAAKMWLKQKKGIDAFNGSVRESTMQYARYMLLLEQYNSLGYEASAQTNTTAARMLELDNSVDSLSKNFKQLFIPVFEWATKVTTGLVKALDVLVVGFNDLLGTDVTEAAKNIGPSEEAIEKTSKMWQNYHLTGEEIDKLSKKLHSFDEVQGFGFMDFSQQEMTAKEAGVDKNVTEAPGGLTSTDGRSAGEQYGESFKQGMNSTIDKLPQSWQQPMKTFFNTTNAEWDKLDEKKKLWSNPMKWFIETVKKGDASAWDAIKAILVQGVHEFPLVAEFEALAKGDMGDFLKHATQTILMGNTMTLPIAIMWKGLDVFDSFRKANSQMSPEFAGLPSSSISVMSSISRLNTKTSPLSSSASSGYSITSPKTPTPVYKSALDQISKQTSSNANTSINVTVGSGSNIIADNYSVKLFGDKIADVVEQRLRSTGRLNMGAR